MLARTFFKGRNSVLATYGSTRSMSTGTYNKMAIPMQKLKFIEHARYGPVYPVVSVDRRKEYPRLARVGTVSLTVFNSLIVYSTFFMPIFTAEFAAIFAHPFLMIPSVFLNYYLYRRNYSLFFLDRSLVTSIFLKPCGTKFIVETRDGESNVVTITDVFMKKYLKSRFDSRIEF